MAAQSVLFNDSVFQDRPSTVKLTGIMMSNEDIYTYRCQLWK